MPYPAPRHRLALAALVRDGRVLLAHRHPGRAFYPDCWDLIGGHIEPGEQPPAAIERECREELGIDISDPQPIAITTHDPDVEMHGFVVRTWVGEPANLAPDENDELRWFSPAELPDLALAEPDSMSDIVAAILGA